MCSRPQHLASALIISCSCNFSKMALAVPLLDIIANSFCMQIEKDRWKSAYKFLHRLGSRHDPSGKHRPEIRTASLCTGSGLGPLTTEKTCSLIAKGAEEPELFVNHVLICEYEGRKQQWLDHMPAFKGSAKMPDVTHFGRDQLRDWHGDVVEVDQELELDVLDAGFSCKDLSTLNKDSADWATYLKRMLALVDRSDMTPDTSEEELQGTTLPTLLGTFRFIMLTLPIIIMLENVVQAKVIWAEIEAMMEYMGYVGALMSVNATQYGHSASRNRVKMMFIRRTHLVTRPWAMASDIVNKYWKDFQLVLIGRMRGSLLKLKIVEPLVTLTDLMLKDTDPLIWNLVDAMTRQSNTKDDWKAVHTRMFRDDLGHPDRPGQLQRKIFRSVLPSRLSRRMFDKSCDRMQEIWMYWTCMVSEGKTDLQDGVEGTVDLSQSLERTTMYKGVSCCMTGSSRILCIRAGRILVGIECLMLQGLPRVCAPRMANVQDNSLLWNLAGNSFAAGSAVAALTSLFLNAPNVREAVEAVERTQVPRRISIVFRFSLVSRSV